MAPEVYRRESYGKSVDVFSFALIVHEVTLNSTLYLPYIFNQCIFHFRLSLLFWYLICGHGFVYAYRCFKGDRLIEQTLQYRLQIDGHMKIHDQLFHLCILNQSRRELFSLHPLIIAKMCP